MYTYLKGMRQYHELLRYILANGEGHSDRTGVGTKSVFGYQNRYDLREGFPLLTTKKMPFKTIMWELMWFLNGRTDNQWLRDKKVTIWDEWATEAQCAKFNRKEGDLGPVYGFLWRHFGAEYGSPEGGVDQIANLINDINKNPNSRRLIVTGWDPRVATNVALPPCHTLWHIKVTVSDDGTKYLDLQLYQRSADSFLGVPFNIASYALLMILIARVTNCTPRNFIHTFGDLHIYNNHFSQVETILSRDPYPLPFITFTDDAPAVGSGLEGLLAFTPNHVVLNNYVFHPPIKADVAV